MALEWEEIVVAVSPSDAQRRPAYKHSRSRHQPLVDRVTQGYIAVSAGSDVANSGESRFERDLRITRAPERFHRRRDAERFVAKARSLPDQMRVRVDEARYERCSRQVDDRCSGGRRSRNGRDPFAGDHDDWVVDRTAALHVEHVRRAYDDDFRIGSWSYLSLGNHAGAGSEQSENHNAEDFCHVWTRIIKYRSLLSLLSGKSDGLCEVVEKDFSASGATRK